MEQMIIFVYDTGYCQSEADDPQKAVLFFHPHWVSDQQRLALCGQLMGAAHFCLTVFSAPRVLTLQCGRFVLKKFGRYILSVGSDQTLSEWILQERFNTLESLVQFYHQSFDSIFNSVDCDQEAFSKKLTEILEIYIPILQFVLCALGNAFVVRCPKKNSAAFLEAFQLLEACCSFKGVLGGVILHNSRVIATQLDPEISKLLAFTDRFHIRKYAEQIKTQFHLPVGVQLIKVNLKQKVYETLVNQVNLKSASLNGVHKKYFQKTGKVVRKKKETNKIFTLHEEDANSNFVLESLDPPNSNSRELIRMKSRKSRSKIENSSIKDKSKSFVGNVNIKVCSTPTIEKTYIHEELVSICSNNKLEQKTSEIKSFVPELVQEAIKTKRQNRILSSTKYSSNRLYRISMDDLMIDLSHKTFPVPLRYYSFGLPRICREVDLPGSEEKTKKLGRRHFYKTIVDPMNPVFRHDGIPVSKSLYNTCLDEHYKDFITANLTIDSREEFLRNKYLENKNLKPKTDICLKSIENKKDNLSLTAIKASDKDDSSEAPQTVKPMKPNDLANSNQKAFRRSLSLPLKPLSCESPDNTSSSTTMKNKVLHARTPTTPLTTKLSLLALEEQTDVKLISTPSENIQVKNVINKNVSNDDKNGKMENVQSKETVTATLFAFGHQNMTLLLFLEEEVEKNPDLILSLWEMSFSVLAKIEALRNKSMANLSTTENNNSSYSYLSLDSQWGTVQRSGPWGDDELKIVGSLHHDLEKTPRITEVIIRNEESVIYGYSCGGTKIFYQQGGCSSAGLPTPADLMGVVTLKARRRLERDRDVVLL